MTRALHRLVPLFATLLLIACGGGGGDSGGAIQPPQAGSIAIQTGHSSMGSHSFTDVTVNVRRHGGAPVADGTTVQLSVTPASLGGVAPADSTDFASTASASTAGGAARFRFRSGTGAGTATLTASANDGVPGTSITATTNITLTGQGGQDNRLTLSADRTVIPVNLENVPPTCRGNPYQAEVTVVWRNINGELVTAADDDAVRASWTSPQSVGAIGTPDDPSTDEDECTAMMASVGVPINAGHGTVFVRSTSEPGTGTLTVGVTDPDTGENLSASMQFTFSSGVPAMPATVHVIPDTGATYIQGSGGSSQRLIRLHVLDGTGAPVPNPESGGDAYNNIKLEIIAPDGERLSTVGADGTTQSGTTVHTRTSNGIASANFFAGTRQGTITLRATADGLDNSVDNGIQQPIVAEATVVVSDGQLFSLHLVSPTSNALFVNPGGITPDGELPIAPDGTYSLTVSALATDRLGNPVIPGKMIQFGLIDSPVSGFPFDGGGFFDLFGLDGDPEEGGHVFIAPSGRFLTAGGGVEIGDALVLFGRDVPGAADLESARIIDSVGSRSRLTVSRRFNLNDGTGQMVDLGPAIPYAIGRAQHGNIHAQATTNYMGLARTEMNYPVNMLGRSVIIWAQSDGIVVAGQNKTVADVEVVSFAGLAPSLVTASPGQIQGNGTSTVTVCQQDALGAPMQGSYIGFAFQDLSSGTASIDGQSGGGSIGPTGGNGCVSATVQTGGITAGEGEPSIRFFDEYSEAIVEILVGEQVLLANPSGFYGTGGTVNLRLLAANGEPISGVQLAGACTGSGGAIVSLSSGPGVTNASGVTTATITATNLNQFGSAGTGSCEFSVPGGEPSANVQVQGIDYCEAAPDNPNCGDAEDPVNGWLDLTLVRGAADDSATATVSGLPGNCSLAAMAGAAQCNYRNLQVGTVIITINLGGGTPASSVNWVGACTPINNNQATVVLPENNAQTCTATLVP
ncbi:MAG: hypothetical protein M0Q42_10015 [Xanthomonadales bacterium]|nr:hypothetical protein [Xanthomonadales bacterium]